VLASSGGEALDLLLKAAEASRPYRLVLLDAMMPGMDGFALADAIRRNPAIRDTQLILLTSAGVTIEAARLRELAIYRTLSKPVKHSDLLETIAAALSGAGSPPMAADARSGPELAPGGSLRLLLVEDGLVNQQVAVRLLEQRGHSVEVANNGLEALQRFDSEAEPFDAILMDVQMPEMDGFEATAAIRARERASGRHVPIVAMTAHAIKGDRERCLAAGMDDYLSKPIRAEELYRVVEAQVIAAPLEPAFDVESALAQLGGDTDTLREIAAIFTTEAPTMLASLRDAVAAGDAGAVRMAAHAIKGSLGAFAAHRAAAAARELERLGAGQRLRDAPSGLATLERELALLLPALRALMDAKPLGPPGAEEPQ
jgi:CheY-like chemotaxis protein